MNGALDLSDDIDVTVAGHHPLPEFLAERPTAYKIEPLRRVIVDLRPPIQDPFFVHDPHKKVTAVFDEPRLTKRQQRRLRGRRP